MTVSCCVMHANIISPAGQPDLSTGQQSHSTRASSSQSPRGWRTAWGFEPEDCGSSLRNTSSQIFIRGHGAEQMLMKTPILTLRERDNQREMLDKPALLKHTESSWRRAWGWWRRAWALWSLRQWGRWTHNQRSVRVRCDQRQQH